MNTTEIFETLKAKFGEKIIGADLESVEPTISLDAKDLKEFMTFIKSDESLMFNSLNCITGVDEDEENLRVIYNLFSVGKNHAITISVIVPKSSPVVETLSSLWKSADWHERETNDLMGVVFKNHPDPRRILLPDDWEGHPLRKDYVTPDFYNGMPVPYDEGEVNPNLTRIK